MHPHTEHTVRMLSCHDNRLRGHSAQGSGQLCSTHPHPQPPIYFQPLIGPRFPERAEAYRVARVARGHGSPAGSGSSPRTASCPVLHSQPCCGSQPPAPNPTALCLPTPPVAVGPPLSPALSTGACRAWGHGEPEPALIPAGVCWQELQAGLQRAVSTGWSCHTNAASQLYTQGSTWEGKEASDYISAGCQGSVPRPKHPSFMGPHPELT